MRRARRRPEGRRRHRGASAPARRTARRRGSGTRRTVFEEADDGRELALGREPHGGLPSCYQATNLARSKVPTAGPPQKIRTMTRTILALLAKLSNRSVDIPRYYERARPDSNGGPAGSKPDALSS